MLPFASICFHLLAFTFICFYLLSFAFIWKGLLRFLSLVGAALGAVMQTLAADTWAVMHWPLVAAFPWAGKAV